ncbi:MAG: RodZ domain-containing protein [Pseudomonadota bacterium]|nr:RodZ domain-containing protein [Pseudomonadota bacterium]
MEREITSKFLDIPEDSAVVQAEPVGQILRLLREERGLELRTISEILCIRYPYLEAIENSSFNDLPGPTYALGFVKAYAEHLGLDSDEIVELFKIEQKGVNSKTELVLPSPLSEGKVPSLAILVVAVLLGLVTYCGWAYFLGNDEQVAEIIPPLPNQLADSSNVIKPNEKQVNEFTGSENTEMEKSENQAPRSTDNSNSLGNEKKKDNVSSVLGTETNELQPQNNTVVPPDGDREEVAAVISNEPQTDTQGPQLSLGEEKTAVSPNQVTEQELLTKVSAKREAKTYGDGSQDSRVTIRAISTTWVEIRDQRKGEVLFTRLLYPGDRYLIANREGLIMLTGNAGGLEISVDGDIVPSIGPSGAVRRNILLDPDALVEGLAVRETTSDEAQGVRENKYEGSQRLDANADQD